MKRLRHVGRIHGLPARVVRGDIVRIGNGLASRPPKVFFSCERIIKPQCPLVFMRTNPGIEITDDRWNVQKLRFVMGLKFPCGRKCSNANEQQTMEPISGYLEAITQCITAGYSPKEVDGQYENVQEAAFINYVIMCMILCIPHGWSM